MLREGGRDRSDSLHKVEAVWPRYDASASELGLDHQPRVDLVVGENRNLLLVPVRQSEIGRIGGESSMCSRDLIGAFCGPFSVSKTRSAFMSAEGEDVLRGSQSRKRARRTHS